MYRYEVSLNWTGGGGTYTVIIELNEPISSSSWSKQVAEAVEKQTGKKPANIYNYKLL
jgi:hypothetical protein